MNFFISWLLFYISIIFAMCVDNLCWIPDSREWGSIKKNFKIIILFGREWGIPKNKEGLRYCWKKRILEVLKHPRDIIPGIITSFLIVIFINIIKNVLN